MKKDVWEKERINDPQWLLYHLSHNYFQHIFLSRVPGYNWILSKGRDKFDTPELNILVEWEGKLKVSEVKVLALEWLKEFV